MTEYRIKKVGKANYLGSIKYKFYKNEKLIAIIITEQEDIQEVIDDIYINKSIDFENEFIILIDNEEE